MKQNYEITALSKKDIKRIIKKHNVNFDFSSIVESLDAEEMIIPFFEELNEIKPEGEGLLYIMDLQILEKDGWIKVWWHIKSPNSYRNYEISTSYNIEVEDYLNQFEGDIVDSLRKMLQGDLEPKKIG